MAEKYRSSPELDSTWSDLLQILSEDAKSEQNTGRPKGNKNFKFKKFKTANSHRFEKRSIAVF